MKTIRYLIGCSSTLVLALSLVPAAMAQEGGGSAAMKSEAAAGTQPQFGREDLEDRRQEIVVANMKFSNDQQKSKFLEVYVPYQLKLAKTLKARRHLYEEFQQDQQNGVIGDAEAAKLLNGALRLDMGVEQALATYTHQLKAVMPEEQVVRAYQLEKRLNALYYTDLLGSTPLAR